MSVLYKKRGRRTRQKDELYAFGLQVWVYFILPSSCNVFLRAWKGSKQSNKMTPQEKTSAAGLFCCVRNNNIKSARTDNGTTSDNLHGAKIAFYAWNKRNSRHVPNSLGKKSEVRTIAVDCRGRACYKNVNGNKVIRDNSSHWKRDVGSNSSTRHVLVFLKKRLLKILRDCQ